MSLIRVVFKKKNDTLNTIKKMIHISKLSFYVPSSQTVFSLKFKIRIIIIKKIHKRRKFKYISKTSQHKKTEIVCKS